MARMSLVLTVTLLIATSSTSAEPKTSEFSGGAWHDVARPTTQKVIEDPTLDRIEQLLDAHQVDPAHELLSPWLAANLKAPDRDRALLLLAQIYFEHGDRLVSFYHCDELMDKHPDSRFFGAALELQFKIADEFLGGFKRKFLGFRILSATDEAIEMLYRIQERSPGSAIAERALLRTADYYFRTSQFDLAGDAYAAFARSYPRSGEISAVKLRQAFSSLAQFHGARYDISSLIDARTQFNDIIDKYPQLAADENVAERIERIDSTLADKLYGTADFYRRTNHPRAAVYVYRTLLRTYPASRDADAARRALMQMPAWALQQSPTGEVEVGVPTIPHPAASP